MTWVILPSPQASLRVCGGATWLLPRFTLVARQRRQRIPRQPVNGPFVHRLCLQRSIELDRWLVPIEHGPLDSAAAALDRQPRQRGQQRFTVPLATMRRLNEKIFEVNSRLGK